MKFAKVTVIGALGLDSGNEWHHFAVTIQNNGPAKIFVDGQLMRIGKSSPTMKILNKGSCIGGERWGHYKGQLDELSFYNRALSDAEIKILAEHAASSIKNN